MRRIIVLLLAVACIFGLPPTANAKSQVVDPDELAKRQWADRQKDEYGIERDAFYRIVRATGHRPHCLYMLQQEETGDEPEGPPDGLVENLGKCGFDVRLGGAPDPDSDTVICSVEFGPQMSPNRMIVDIDYQDYHGKSTNGEYVAIRVGNRWTFPKVRVSRRLERSIERRALHDCRHYKNPGVMDVLFATPNSAVVGVVTQQPGPTDGHIQVIIDYERIHGRWKKAVFYEYEGGV